MDTKLKSQKRIAKNTLIYSVKQLCSVLFPLLTFSYASESLGVAGIGSVNYIQSIVTYFIVLSGLGISTYAIKNGTKIRHNKEEMNKFVSELFMLNIIATAISLTLYLLIVVFAESLQNYLLLSLVFALEIPFTTLGIEWIYNCYEDFAYITVRSVAVQVISFILVVILVRDTDDVVIYGGITIIANVGSNILNYLHAHKYVQIRLTGINTARHIKPVIILFGMTIATTIYTTMDTTMIGYMKGDYEVGIYAAAHKIPRVLTRLIATIRTVSLPAMVREESKTEKSYTELSGSILNTVIMLSLPIVALMITNNKAIILSLFGAEFVKSIPVFNFLSLDILLSALSGTFVYQYVLIKYKESYSCLITWIGMIVNLVANCILISKYNALGAAVATCISELVVCAISYMLARKSIIGKEMVSCAIQATIGCLGIIAVSKWLYKYFMPDLLGLLVVGSICAITYIGIVTSFKRNPLSKIIRTLMSKILRRHS